MPIYILATEIDLMTYKHLRYFKFHLDGGKSFCYRSRMSYNSFAHGNKRKNYNLNKYLYHCDSWHDKISPRPLLEGVEIIEVDSLWEFYNAIRFDYKQSKYF